MSSAGHVARAPQELTGISHRVEAVARHKWMRMFKQILANLNLLYTAVDHKAVVVSFGSHYSVS